MKQLPKKLYHVSLDLNQTGVFTPRVPESRMQSEDSKTPRFCVSDSIEGCLTASGFGAHYLGESLVDNNDLMKVFVIDTEKLGLTLSDVISPDELYQSGKVNDAHLTREHWILKKISVPTEDQMVVRVTHFSDYTWKMLLEYQEYEKLSSIKGLKMEGEEGFDFEVLEEVYYEIYKTQISSLCIIESLQFNVLAKEELV